MYESAFPAPVIQALVPVMTYSSPSRSAWQASAAASEPACGSDRLYAPSMPPPSRSGSHLSCCSGVPKVASGKHDRPCTLTATATAAQRIASSSSTCR